MISTLNIAAFLRVLRYFRLLNQGFSGIYVKVTDLFSAFLLVGLILIVCRVLRLGEQKLRL